jgi:hypothetical protein
MKVFDCGANISPIYSAPPPGTHHFPMFQYMREVGCSPFLMIYEGWTNRSLWWWDYTNKRFANPSEFWLQDDNPSHSSPPDIQAAEAWAHLINNPMQFRQDHAVGPTTPVTFDFEGPYWQIDWSHDVEAVLERYEAMVYFFQWLRGFGVKNPLGWYAFPIPSSDTQATSIIDTPAVRNDPRYRRLVELVQFANPSNYSMFHHEKSLDENFEDWKLQTKIRVEIVRNKAEWHNKQIYFTSEPTYASYGGTPENYTFTGQGGTVYPHGWPVDPGIIIRQMNYMRDCLHVDGVQVWHDGDDGDVRDGVPVPDGKRRNAKLMHDTGVALPSQTWNIFSRLKNNKSPKNWSKIFGRC